MAVIRGSVQQASVQDRLLGALQRPSCCSAAFWSLVWAAAITVRLRSLVKQTAITDTLLVSDEHLTSSVEAARTKRWRAAVITYLDFLFSMTEALISKVFKRPVPWDHRIKDYHNRGFIDEWRNLSQTLHLHLVLCYVPRSKTVIERQKRSQRGVALDQQPQEISRLSCF